MSGESDIAAIVTAETRDFSGPILQAEEDAKSLFRTIVDGGQQALSAMTRALASLAGDIAAETKAVLLDVGHNISVMALEAALLGGAVTATGSYFAGFWNTMRAGLTVASWFVPWLKVATVSLTVGTAAVWAYRQADEYLNGELSATTFRFQETRDAAAGFSKQLEESQTQLGMVGDGLGSLSAQAVQFAMDWGGMTLVMNAVDDVSGAVIDTLTAGMKVATDATQTVTESMADWLSTAGAGAADLRDLAAATEELNAKQLEQTSIFSQLRAIQDEAAVSAEHRAELQRIASLTTVDSVNAEITALQQRAVAATAAGEADEAWLRRTGDLFQSLENQKINIAAGKMEQKPGKESEFAVAMRQAERELATLTMGKDEAALAALKNSGATEEEIAALRKHLEAINSLNQAKQAEREMASQMAAAAKAEEAQQKRTADQIAATKDEIDVLTGAITKQEAARRSLMRSGLTAEQADELAALQAEKDRLAENSKKKPEKSSKDTSVAFAAMGSKEAYSTILRAVGGRTKEDEIAKNTAKTNQQLDRLVRAAEHPLRKNSGPTLTDLSGV